jgi:uncharacterized HhH-GPD family protein
MPLSLPIDADANDLLERSPLALVIAMLLDQQVTIEKAFTSPRDLVRRLGHEPTAAELADFDPGALAAIFSERPALHRYPRAMAARVQQLCQEIVARYEGDAGNIWAGATTGGELLARVSALPGFGADKSRIFVALLGKQLGVRPKGWRQAAGHFGAEGSRCSVADITDAESRAAVRAYKQGLKAAAKAAHAAATGAAVQASR